MRRIPGIPACPGQRPLGIALLALTLAGSASAQSSRIPTETAQQIQAKAAQLLASPEFTGVPIANRDQVIASFVLSSFALAAHLPNLDESQLNADERDQAQRVIGAVLGGAAATTPRKSSRPRPPVYTYPSYYHHPASVLVPPRYVYAAPPAPPVVVLPPPPPFYYLSPAPAYVIPVRHHKWGW